LPSDDLSSARTCLPRFTDIDVAAWENALRKGTFIKEFWPAQRLLGENGVFRGRSAVVQMPTSAGKTKATEILIRSAFLSRRTDLAVIVAPFRALCHEIRDSMIVAFRGEDILVDEISDVPQDDLDLATQAGSHRVIILTPEKLLYILRQRPELAETIGVLIYDEGHQFDCGARGITYELLVTSLKKVVPLSCQVVLISAVITNADAINQWLNGDDGMIVAGAELHPTLRSIAFASWTDTLGRLEFLGQRDSGDYAYFVPRVIEAKLLQSKSPREKPRYFPARRDGQSIALYLGLKLVEEGSVAIFCGLKGSVGKVCEKLIDAYERQLELPKPLEVSNAEEVRRLARLIKRQLGENHPMAKCAEFGVFTHHGSTPAGIRLSVEYAMKESLIALVVCTSTLAQGVNLPIRYLIVTGTYQGAERISVRDFQNLMGRAGRSGMHTEGSVIFADPETYDSRRTPEGRWKWGQIEELFDPANAKACASSLLALFDPLDSDDRRVQAKLNVRIFFEAYLGNEDGLPVFASELAQILGRERFSVSNLVSQLQPRGKIIEALESYMMSVSTGDDSEFSDEAFVDLAKGTLAYHLADPGQRGDLEALFRAVGNRVRTKVPSQTARAAYARSLLGVTHSLAIHQWAVQTQDPLAATSSDRELLDAIWPTLSLAIGNSAFVKCTLPTTLPELAARWIDEESPAEILAFLKKERVRFGEGTRPRHATIDHVVDLCENALAFEGVLVLAAICECLRLETADEELILRIANLRKRLKYGLRSAAAIALHEIGFSDRVVSSDLATFLKVTSSNSRRLRIKLRTMKDQVSEFLEQYPSYFSFVATNA
jgi:superfamily II DNA/RNA helicase